LYDIKNKEDLLKLVREHKAMEVRGLKDSYSSNLIDDIKVMFLLKINICIYIFIYIIIVIIIFIISFFFVSKKKKKKKKKKKNK